MRDYCLKKMILQSSGLMNTASHGRVVKVDGFCVRTVFTTREIVVGLASAMDVGKSDS